VEPLKPTWYRTVKQVEKSYYNEEQLYKNFAALLDESDESAKSQLRIFFNPLHKKLGEMHSKTLLSLGDKLLLKEFQEFAQTYKDTANELFGSNND